MATVAKDRYIEGIGRRKRSTARVRLVQAAKSSFVINDQKIEEYFPLEELINIVKAPLAVEGQTGHFSVSVHVLGGGIHSQSEAIRHGLSRALLKGDDNLKKSLRDNGFLTRDSREKERRKFGKKGKARKSPQWSKR